MQFVQVEISKLDANAEGNIRAHVGGIADLAKSIEEVGLLEPVVVRRVDSGFALVSGFRRLAACIKLGWDSIPAHVIDAEADHAVLAQATENGQRAAFSWYDQAEGVKRLQAQDPKPKAAQIARALGLGHPSMVSHLARIAASTLWDAAGARARSGRELPGIAAVLAILARCDETGRDPSLPFQNACVKLDAKEGGKDKDKGKGKGKKTKDGGGEGEAPSYPVRGARKIHDLYDALRAEERSEARDYALALVKWICCERESVPHGIKLPERKPGRKPAEAEESADE